MAKVEKMSSDENFSESGCGMRINFSRRDKIQSDPEYFQDIYDSAERLHSYVFAIFIVISFILALILPVPSEINSSLTFYSTSVIPLGAVLGILLSITLVFVQIYTARFGSEIYSYLATRQPIVGSILYILIAILIPLIGLSIIGQLSGTLLFQIFNRIVIFSTLTGFITVVFFSYMLVDYFEGERYTRWLYNKVIHSIEDQNKSEFEEYLHTLIHVTHEGIDNRNRGAIKEGIESLHDLFKYGIDNRDEIFEMDSTYIAENNLMGDRSGWLSEEICNSFESYFFKFHGNKPKEFCDIPN